MQIGLIHVRRFKRHVLTLWQSSAMLHPWLIFLLFNRIFFSQETYLQILPPLARNRRCWHKSVQKQTGFMTRLCIRGLPVEDDRLSVRLHLLFKILWSSPISHAFCIRRKMHTKMQQATYLYRPPHALSHTASRTITHPLTCYHTPEVGGRCANNVKSQISCRGLADTSKQNQWLYLPGGRGCTKIPRWKF